MTARYEKRTDRGNPRCGCGSGGMTSPANSPPTPAELVLAITACPPGCYIERRPIVDGKVGRQDFCHPDDPRLQQIARASTPRENIFFGVAPRIAAKGDAPHCYGLSSLFVDLDFKTTPSEQAQGMLAGFPLPASAIVATGGGLHVYWLLITAILFPDGFALAKSLLRRLAIMIQADLAAAEPVRILRVPSSFNYKYDPARPVQITHWCPSLHYSVEQFETLLADVAERGQMAEFEVMAAPV